MLYLAAMAVVTTVPEPNLWNEICKGMSRLNALRLRISLSHTSCLIVVAFLLRNNVFDKNNGCLL